MDDLLTANDVQERLKIDRTTVYRMLKDGRLTGAKIGRQWRFPAHAIDALLRGEASGATPDGTPPPNVLPLHCLQPIQDVFADLAGVGAVTTAPDGSALTALSNGCRFCALIRSSTAGRAACAAEWAQLAAQSAPGPQAAICHAGLSYVYGRIDVAGSPAAVLVGGQFRLPESRTAPAALAERYHLDAQELTDALADVPAHAPAEVARIGAGVRKVAATFAALAAERAAIIERFRHIAELSAW